MSLGGRQACSTRSVELPTHWRRCSHRAGRPRECDVEGRWCLNVRANETPLAFVTPNAPWAATGYGQQTGLFLPYLKEHYDLAISAFYGLEAGRLIWDDVPVYPGMGNEYGGMFLEQHARNHFGGDPRGGMVVTLLDVWVLPSDIGGKLNMVSWTPVDHEPVPGAVQAFFAAGAVPLAMSRFGERQLGDLDPLYCPHGVDTEVFRPYDRREMRRRVGVPEDAFLVGMVAANKGRPSRKGFQQAFEAFRLFSEQHEDAQLYLHTMIDPSLSAGEHLQALISGLGIPAEKIRQADQYMLMFDPLPPAAMARVYSTFDVLLNPAQGEGFGIPVLEAQACGVPVIVTNFSAMPEVGKVGWQVGCRPVWTGQNSWQAVADVGEIAEALKHCYSLSDSGRQELSRLAREHALGYDAKRVFETFMLPALREAEERFEDRQPVRLRAVA